MARETDARGKGWLIRNVSKYRPSIIFLTVLTVLATVCSVGFAYLSSFLIDNATDGDRHGIIVFSAIVLSLLIGRIALRAIINFYSEKCRATITTDIRGKIFKKVLKTKHAEITGYHSGEIVTRITADASEIAGTTVGLLPQTVGIIIQVIASVVALVAIDGLFTLFLIGGGIIVIGVSAFLRKKTKWYYREIMSADGESRSFMQESILSSLTVKAFGAEEKTSQKANGILERYRNRRVGRARLNSLIGILYSCITNIGLVFAIVWCAFGIMDGMAYGSVLSIVLLMEQLQRPLNTVSAIMPAYYSRIASAERLCEIDGLKEEIPVKSDIEYSSIKKIKVENVDFCYDNEKVLDGLTLEIPTGKMTCIYGVSGGGKSTLFKLLLGVYTPTDGKVRFETENGDEKIDLGARDLFAFVPQGNFLFSGTIYENLTFFSNEKEKDVLDERVKWAIEKSRSQFVYELPNGVNTVLTEQGGGLSEGQRQRLAVARAFVSERPILLFDEATSALDDETEQALLQNIKEMKDKTCIIISHRQAVIDSSDVTIKI
ncbi:MAG: ABC transporter ATP-binding protein [Clostridiales bacterium]|nr:ABC transporter ATP-binding protein [Clostridiales bacterium]